MCVCVYVCVSVSVSVVNKGPFIKHLPCKEIKKSKTKNIFAAISLKRLDRDKGTVALLCC